VIGAEDMVPREEDASRSRSGVKDEGWEWRLVVGEGAKKAWKTCLKSIEPLTSTLASPSHGTRPSANQTRSKLEALPAIVQTAFVSRPSKYWNSPAVSS